MPTPSKFTEAGRRLIVAALGCGASRRTASRLAGVDHQTLGRWLARGRASSPGGRWRDFHDAVLAAEAAPSRVRPCSHSRPMSQPPKFGGPRSSSERIKW